MSVGQLCSTLTHTHICPALRVETYLPCECTAGDDWGLLQTGPELIEQAIECAVRCNREGREM